jgi:site-specific DNA recombinase
VTEPRFRPWEHPTGPGLIAELKSGALWPAESPTGWLERTSYLPTPRSGGGAGPGDTANYARISDDPGSRRRGVDRQLRDGREVIARMGLRAYDEYQDDDVSAFRPNPRRERRQDFKRLWADIEAGHIRNLVLWRPDRLCRDGHEGEDLIDLFVKHHVLLIPHTGLPADLSTPEGEKWFRDAVSNGRYESRVLSMRATRAARDYAEQGLLGGGGGRPFGYESDKVTIREEEAAVIRTLADRADAGESLRSLCLWLIDSGVPTVHGGPWSTTVLRTMLTSGRIAGRRDYKGDDVALAIWPGIITPEQSDRIRTLVEGRRRLNVQPARRYLLTGGRARCHRCREGLVARPKGDKRRNYICAKPPVARGCGGVAILAEYLEGHVVGQVLARLDTPAVWEALRHPEQGDPQAAIVEEIARKRAKREESDALWREDAITREQYLRNSSTLRAEIDALARRLARGNRVIVFRGIDDAAALRARWDELGVDRQQGILDALIDHVTVRAANHGRNRFDPRRFEIEWKV